MIEQGKFLLLCSYNTSYSILCCLHFNFQLILYVQYYSLFPMPPNFQFLVFKLFVSVASNFSYSSELTVSENYKPECQFLDTLYTTNLHQLITYKTNMSVSPFSIDRLNSQFELSEPTVRPTNSPNGTLKILTNFILKPPPESQKNLDAPNIMLHEAPVGKQGLDFQNGSSIFQKYKQKKSCWERSQFSQIKQDEDVRVKAKLNKKGKRDGQNIRTYARYDSVIQALEQELLLQKIVPTNLDKKMLDEFQMKSKRSLERFFFYLLLAKRENKLKILLPNLKLKIRTKIQQKGGHRTSQFLSSLQNCIQKYLDAAEKLDLAQTVEQAKSAFSIAYLSDNSTQKRPPHHNKIKGIDKCLKIYKIIMCKSDQTQASFNELNHQVYPSQIKNQTMQDFQQPKIEHQFEMICENSQHKSLEGVKFQKKKQQQKRQDESFSMVDQDMKDLTGDKKKKIGVKNKKQDDRDIQKYAKFDIVSQSSLQFLKLQKLQRNIPEICKKLSQRSLHFFFVILAMIQKEKKDAEFLTHLETNYERKVQKRYSQRSEYFRERLHQSFFNLIQATRALFEGHLEEALDIAYEVKSEKKTHPAKASQQKRCKQIYEAIRSSFQGTGEDCKRRLELLIQNGDKGHRSQLIKQIKSPTTKTASQIYLQPLKISELGLKNQGIDLSGKFRSLTLPSAQFKMDEQNFQIHETPQRFHRSLDVIIPIPHKLTFYESEPVLENN